METVCFRIKLKKGCIHDVREWFKTLRDRESEALKSLENEGVIIESVFLEQHCDEYFLIYYMKAKNLTFAREISKKSLLPIDIYHKECKDKFCEEHCKLEQLLDLYP